MAAGLRIAFFGSSLVSAYWNGAATYYRGIIRALHELGHNITFYEPDAYDRQQHRDLENPDYATVVVYGTADESDALRMVEEAGQCDIIIKTSGVGVFDELLEAAVLTQKKENNLIFFWDVDAPATLERLQQNQMDPFRRLIPHYDAIFTYGGGPRVVNSYRRLQARGCYPIYNAVDPLTHHQVEHDPRFAGACGFLGHRLPDREARVEEFFLKPAARLPDQRFLLGGNGWGDKPMPPNVDYMYYVSPQSHNAFNCTLQTVLNINRSSMAHTGFSPPTRVFEAAGAGACLITDAWEGIAHFLEPGQEVLVAENGDAVVEHLSSLDQQQARNWSGRPAAGPERTYVQPSRTAIY
ncbi:MAG: glycosyltransferase [Caldilineaceae bacterium]